MTRLYYPPQSFPLPCLSRFRDSGRHHPLVQSGAPRASVPSRTDNEVHSTPDSHLYRSEGPVHGQPLSDVPRSRLHHYPGPPVTCTELFSRTWSTRSAPPLFRTLRPHTTSTSDRKDCLTYTPLFFLTCYCGSKNRRTCLPTPRVFFSVTSFPKLGSRSTLERPDLRR